jgi:hypothetical protein
MNSGVGILKQWWSSKEYRTNEDYLEVVLCSLSYPTPAQ